MVMLATGTRGQTSIAPKRGCAPWCLLMSISSAAFRAERTAASMTASGVPTKVTTVRFRRLTGIDVEQTDAVDGFNLVGDLLDEGEVVAFAEVGDTFDQLLAHLRVFLLLVWVMSHCQTRRRLWPDPKMMHSNPMPGKKQVSVTKPSPSGDRRCITATNRPPRHSMPEAAPGRPGRMVS